MAWLGTRYGSDGTATALARIDELSSLLGDAAALGEQELEVIMDELEGLQRSIDEGFLCGAGGEGVDEVEGGEPQADDEARGGRASDDPSPPQGSERSAVDDARDAVLFEKALRCYDPRFTEEREPCYLVGLDLTGHRGAGAAAAGAAFSVDESLAELSELCGTAGLEVRGSSTQRLAAPHPRTYIGKGKVAQVKRALADLPGCCTVVLDDELSPGQQRALEAEFGTSKGGKVAFPRHRKPSRVLVRCRCCR